MRLRTCALLLSLLTIGCMDPAGDPADEVATSEQGLTEIRIDADALLAAGITQVTLASGAQSKELVLNPATGTYDGTLILPAGPQSVVARAFAGMTLVGASNPTEVNVEADKVTRVMLRILDLTSSAPPLYGPILDSLVYPATTQAMAPITLTASVVAPVGDPVTYEWSSSCADATFSAPAAATTSWSKAAQGSCTITMLATSNGLSVTQSFQIVVFPAGSGSGAIDTSASFISVPRLSLEIPTAGCLISPSSNASCAGSFASPSVTGYRANVTSWGGSTPGPITVTDNCGGKVGTQYRGSDYRSGHWLPPVGAGVCILTVTAVSGDGLVATLRAALLVRAGTPPASAPLPSITGSLSPGPCSLTTPSPIDCGAVPAGTTKNIFGNVSWGTGTPGSVTLSNDCNSSLNQPTSAYSFSGPWILPNLPGETCTLTIRAVNLQGGMREVSAQYLLQ